MNLGAIFTQIGTVGIIVIIILVCLSIGSWAIIFEKSLRLIRAGRESKRFLYIFDLYTDWRDIETETQRYRFSPYINLFRQALNYSQATGLSRPTTDRARSELVTKETSPAQLNEFKQHLETTISNEILALEKGLIFLSSTVSAAPFLGLFGTVWGVMQAFLSISARGSAAMSVIGAGIAEALITTVVGLAVAIPVLFAYNLIVDKIQKYQAALINFYPAIVKKFNLSRAYVAQTTPAIN